MIGFEPLISGASRLAEDVDALFYAMVALCGTVLLGISLVILVFAVRYRRGSKAARGGAETSKLGIELAWTAIPFILFLGIFAWSVMLFARIETMPEDATRIYVVAKQWMWKVQHADGRREINQLHVPLGQTVRLTMISQDVIHSFFVPAFRVKQDVLPQRYTELWFTPEKTGEFDLYCAEFCGTDHSGMTGRIVVMTPGDYAAWAEHGERKSLARRGAALFRSRGCSGCHGANATVRAPDLAGVFGKPVPLAGGGTVIADTRYLRDSILLPNKEVAAGFDPIMPSFEGQLGEEDVIALTAYIQSLSEETGDEQP